MKRRWILVIGIVGLVVTVSAQNTRNGHDQEKVLDCKLCHLCENPTRENPCLRSCPRYASLTVKHSPSDAPEVIVMDDLKELYVPVVFSHRLHAEMADMSSGCVICHHYNPPGKILSCGECHERPPVRADLRKPGLKGAYHRQCLGCHRDWSHETKCALCHAPITSLKTTTVAVDTTDVIGVSHPVIPEPDKVVYQTGSDKGRLVTFYHDEHTGLYSLRCVNCHVKESCSRCHQSAKEITSRNNNKSTAKNIKKSEEEHHQACYGCHSGDKCALCHGETARDRFNHGLRSGWALNRYHNDLDCERCHGNLLDKKRLSKECNNCHSDWDAGTFKHRVTGIALDENHIENGCEECHPARKFDQPPRCENCHDEDIRFPKKIPGERVNQDK